MTDHLTKTALDDQEPPIKRIMLYRGDRLFNESKISNSFSARARASIEPPQFAAAMIISAAMKARAILVAYWVEVIGLARGAQISATKPATCPLRVFADHRRAEPPFQVAPASAATSKRK
jgi:hypothetical protein